VCQPHEYSRGGTAKLLTLFRPATGEVRAKGVTNAPNVVLHPWLQKEVLELLADMPDTPMEDSELPTPAQWPTWLGHEPRSPLPPLRLILIWDNLAGHLSWSIVKWLFAHGVMPLYTPLSGSWLNMAESVQRILIGRALSGQHPTTALEVITWLEETVAGWNAAPTPFVWDGKRRERRVRARQRRLGGSAASPNHQLIAASPTSARPLRYRQSPTAGIRSDPRRAPTPGRHAPGGPKRPEPLGVEFALQRQAATANQSSVVASCFLSSSVAPAAGSGRAK
jgi:hypothetical protein